MPYTQEMFIRDEFYGLEGIDMPYTQEMFIRDYYPEWYEKIQAAKNEGRAEGINECRNEGRTEGKLIGEILMAQRFLKRPVWSEEELAGKDIEELKQIVAEIESRLTF